MLLFHFLWKRFELERLGNTYHLKDYYPDLQEFLDEDEPLSVEVSSSLRLTPIPVPQYLDLR